MESFLTSGRLNNQLRLLFDLLAQDERTAPSGDTVSAGVVMRADSGHILYVMEASHIFLFFLFFLSSVDILFLSLAVLKRYMG